MGSLRENILDGTEYYQGILNDIDLAKTSIRLEAYIFNNDLFGISLAQALSRAATRGVDVRVLVDGIGTPVFHQQLSNMEVAGVLVRVFHPIPFHLAQSKRSNYGSGLLFKVLHTIAKLNSRNHRKTCVIDENIVYIGSANIDQRHLNKQLGGENWFDITARLTNLNTRYLKLAFNLAWDRGFFHKYTNLQLLKKAKPTSIFRLNYSRKLRKRLYNALLKKIANAKKRIWVINPYFNPDYYILENLIAASKRGVDVKIILPGKTDVISAKIIAGTFYLELLKAGISIYEYTDSVLHAKVINIDNWYCVGSSNFNYRSFRYDLEVDVILQNIANKKSLHNTYLKNFLRSRKINLADMQNKNIFKKMLAYIFLFLKAYM